MFDDRIQLPKLGTLRLKERNYLPASGVKVLSATVSERAGKWFVSVLVEEEVRQPIEASGQPIGVDLGISSLAVCSDGRPPIKNPKALRTNLKRLKRYQRHLSRCKKGSKNREKARHQVARLHARIANIREDALHKATSSLVHAPLPPSERIGLKTHLASLLPLPKTKAEQKKTKKQIKKRFHQTTAAGRLSTKACGIEKSFFLLIASSLPAENATAVAGNGRRWSFLTASSSAKTRNAPSFKFLKIGMETPP